MHVRQACAYISSTLNELDSEGLKSLKSLSLVFRNAYYTGSVALPPPHFPLCARMRTRTGVNTLLSVLVTRMGAQDITPEGRS